MPQKPKRPVISSVVSRRQETATDINMLALVGPALSSEQCPRIDAMRKITRTFSFLVLLEDILGFDDFTVWLERRTELLGGDAPLDRLNRRQWKMMGDFLDDILTGVPT